MHRQHLSDSVHAGRRTYNLVIGFPAVPVQIKYSDFNWYHHKYQHHDANLKYLYRHFKIPEHLVHY
jgi:hypothetical protein